MDAMYIIGLVLATALVANGQTATAVKRCPFGWFKPQLMPTCLWASKFKATWLDGDRWCSKMGGHLAEVHSAQMNIVLTMLIGRQQSKGKYWIGLTDVPMEGQFTWMQSNTLATPYTFFQSGKGRGGVTKNCVYVDEKGLWGDEPCKSEFWFICQK